MPNLFKITYIFLTIALVSLMTGCNAGGSVESGVEDGYEENSPVRFECYLQRTKTTRAVSPTGGGGAMDITRLKSLNFGVFTQYTSNTAWASYATDIPFNFMWNQEVTWDEAWTYTPVKYWPNDNQPADDQDPAAQGSQGHSYLSFFGYAPYTDDSDLGADYDKTDDATADGIVKISANSTNNGDAYIYYRTSNEKPFGVDESVDLLWAIPKTDRYKTHEDGDGKVNGHVDMVFMHALTKLTVNTMLYVDRTASHSSPAYSTDLDANTKIFIESATITTPDYYSEGKLMIAPKQTTPQWDYTGVDDAKKQTGFAYNSNDADAIDDVKYSLRYAAPNIPQNHTITDENSDGLDDETGLTLAETTKAAFDAMEAGVTATEQQLSANYATYIFPPSTDTQDITIRVVYHVVTYDDKLRLNNPKYYSHITNDITASVGDSDFKFDPNKQYKILLSLGVTSAKFDIYVLSDNEEYILLSSVVKNWDEKVIEGNVE